MEDSENAGKMTDAVARFKAFIHAAATTIFKSLRLGPLIQFLCFRASRLRISGGM